ncbi:MAG TPA: phosphoribosyltransferase family protein [Candidatus Baltobacteraceae bacterium]|jgi:predicted phosphoribosyltransferase
MTPFRNRADAGRALASRLVEDARNREAIVLALPRGGVPVGYEIARELKIPMDVVLVRKLGVPGREELAMGAVATSGVFFIDQWMVDRLSISREQVEDVIERERAELLRREREYRGDRPAPDVRGMTVICVDDGLATGASMRVAVAAVRESHPARVVIAVPVAAPGVADALRDVADSIVVARLPENLRAVSVWYQDFSQTTDEEVRDLLARMR